MRKLILVEGLPGSGKTTLSRKISEYMTSLGEVHLYQEGDLHPADLAWCACIPVDQLEHIFEQFPAYEEPVKKHMFIDGDYAIVPYVKFPIEDKDFYRLMESHEVYDNRAGYETFCSLHAKKWQRFGEGSLEKDDIYVFECAFLQNHINELLLFHCMSEEQIEKYLLNLISTVTPLEPILIYLSHPNVHDIIEMISEERVDEVGNKVWMERVIEYIQQSPFGVSHGLKGFEGMITYFEHRKKIELSIIPKLLIDTYIIANAKNDWDYIWSEIQSTLNNNFDKF